jgi:hypothetical protein
MNGWQMCRWLNHHKKDITTMAYSFDRYKRNGDYAAGNVSKQI